MTNPTLTTTDNPFRLPPLTRAGLSSAWLERLLGLDRLAAWYERRPLALDARQFARFTLDRLGVDYRLDAGSLDELPREGGMLVVANHPYGGLEGVALLHLLGAVRPDLKILANAFLSAIPELAEHFIPLDVFHPGRNQRALRQAVAHVRQGGALLLFPAGEVSSWRLAERRVSDPAWHVTAAAIAQKTQAPVVPVHIAGRNSLWFQAAGLLHRRLRTLLLAREMLNKAGRTLSIRLGNPIAADELRDLDRRSLTHYLRLNCEWLADSARPAPCPARREAPLAPPVDPGKLSAEVDGLGPERLLHVADGFEVYLASAAEIPLALAEIGRLREQSFRAAGEGTGKPADLDAYDGHYRHLFLWDRSQARLVGAYRIGRVRDIVSRQGLDGLYTRSLFRYDWRFLRALGGDGLEMGRSFVRAEYQRNPRVLYALWCGIGRLVARLDGPTTLFGAVSISADYRPDVRKLIAQAMSLYHVDASLSALVQPRKPLAGLARRDSRTDWSCLADIGRLSRLVARLEHGPGLPVLLRHYLGLNGRLAGFHIDASFNNSLAGLIVVDLRQAPPKALARYMGADGAARFLHTQQGIPAC
ncbi:MAG: lysophospholipid acyltransferase family protein [Gammaproteobacteria bacterium]|nr:lysophospholipid acyltransferase family protein [Gammaproteobacteria bacterium]